MLKEGLPWRWWQQLPPERWNRAATLNYVRCQTKDHSNNWLTTSEGQRHAGPNNEAELCCLVMAWFYIPGDGSKKHVPLGSTHSVQRNLVRDSLCGLVVRVPGYRSRGPGSFPDTTRFSEKQWVWNGIHSASSVQFRSYLEGKVAAPV
jgi:hypothetical protein